MRNLGHAVFELKYHIILVTKYRRPVLIDEIAERLKKETERLITESFNGQVIEMETDMDHIHILAEISPRYSIAEVVNVLKGVTSRILKREYAERIRKHLRGEALWSRSYYVSSVGGAPLEVLKTYIGNQGEVRGLYESRKK